MLPSGGLRRGEDPVATAKRELVEETGCRLYEARVVRILNEDLHGARHCIHVVAGTVSDRAQPDGREVVEARFYALDDLPAETSAGAVETLQTWAGPTGTADAGDMQRP